MDIEVIERKGLGHPDTICDNLAEHLAELLIEEYIKQYGSVKHYNVDKVLASCGRIDYNNKEMLEPVKIVFSGNATEIDGLDELLKKTVENILRLEIKRGLKYQIFNHISFCSPDLTANFDLKKSNDTSFSVGSPLTKNEKLVLEMGKYLEEFSNNQEHIGSDYKIMFVNGKIIIALAFICKNVGEYNLKKQEVLDKLKQKFSIEDISINLGDTPDSIFNTVSGTSLEQGDAGMVGRGNRYNGLITPMKPMTMEAYCGKNNITHIGRIYQKKAFEMAQEKQKNILLVTHIGGNIDNPTIFEWA